MKKVRFCNKIYQMKALALVLPLLLACGSCKSKVQEAQEEEDKLDISIVGTWQYLGYWTDYCDGEEGKPAECFVSADKATKITFYDDFRYQNEANGPASECAYESPYSLSERRESNGTPFRVVIIKGPCWPEFQDIEWRYEIIRTKSGDIHLHLNGASSYDKKNYSVYKKL